jgi:hypothetical protein
MTANATAARAMAFLVFLFILLSPGAVILTRNQSSDVVRPLDQDVLSQLWLLSPLQNAQSAENDSAVPVASLTATELIGRPFGLSLLRSGVIAFLLGFFIYPFYRPVIPGAGSRRNRKAVAAKAGVG